MRPCKHQVHYDATRPYISVVQSTLIFGQLLRRQAIQLAKAHLLKGALAYVDGSILAEVKNLDAEGTIHVIIVVDIGTHQLLLDEDVVGSQVPVDEAMLLRIFQGQEDLSHDEGCHVFCEERLACLLEYPVEDGYALLGFCDDVHVLVLHLCLLVHFHLL